MCNMASSAPFGTDLQPDFNVKVIAGKLVEIAKVDTKVQNEEGVKDGQAVHALISQIFGTSNPQQRVEKFLLSCFRRDTLGAGFLSRKCLERVLHEERLTLTRKQLSDLIRTTKASTGVTPGEINYQKLCSGVTSILSENKHAVLDETSKLTSVDAREPLDTGRVLSSNGSTRDRSERVASRLQAPYPVAQVANTSSCSCASDNVGRRNPAPASTINDQCPVELKPVASEPFMRLGPELSESNKLMIREGLFRLKHALTNCSSVSGNQSQNRYVAYILKLFYMETF